MLARKRGFLYGFLVFLICRLKAEIDTYNQNNVGTASPFLSEKPPSTVVPVGSQKLDEPSEWNFEEFKAQGGCTQKDMTAIVNVTLHTDKEISSIISDAVRKDPAKWFGPHIPKLDNSGYEEQLAFFGSAVSHLNRMLSPFHIQVDLKFEKSLVEESSVLATSDPTCKLSDTVVKRTEDSLAILTNRHSGIGLNVFVFACLLGGEDDNRYDDTTRSKPVIMPHMIPRGGCGAVSGIVYQGEERALRHAEESVLRMLTREAEEDFSDYIYHFPTTAELTNKAVNNRLKRFAQFLCGHVDSCVSNTISSNGEITDKVELRSSADAGETYPMEVDSNNNNI
ncbi:hypothetical protein ENBRE01_0243 [Enteropsectra breve]|nr:hypothetical protein ENBRE01_0243 [Enteropsectra breve]